MLGRPWLLAIQQENSRPRAHDRSGLRQGWRPGRLQHRKSAIHGLLVKSEKLNWLHMLKQCCVKNRPV